MQKWSRSKERSLRRYLNLYPQNEAIRRFAKNHGVTERSVRSKVQRITKSEQLLFVNFRNLHHSLGVCQKTTGKIVDFLQLKEYRFGAKRCFKREEIKSKLYDRTFIVDFCRRFPQINIVGLKTIIQDYGICKRIEAIRDSLQSSGQLRQMGVPVLIETDDGGIISAGELAKKLCYTKRHILDLAAQGKFRIYREPLTSVVEDFE